MIQSPPSEPMLVEVLGCTEIQNPMKIQRLDHINTRRAHPDVSARTKTICPMVSSDRKYLNP